MRILKCQPKYFFRSGFTLVELMVTIAVVGILSTLAVSSYSSVMAKGDRATALSDIIEITQSLERYFSFNRIYSNNFEDLSMASSAAYNIQDAQGLYTYYIVIPGTTITPGTSTAASKSATQLNGLSYAVYAEPNTKNRDHWTLSIDELGFKYHFESPHSSESNKKAVEGWP